MSERSCLDNAIPHDPWALFKQLCLVHGALVCGNNSTRTSVPSFVGFLVIKESEPSVFAHNRVFSRMATRKVAPNYVTLCLGFA